MTPKTQAILAAAGTGTRLKSKQDKPLVEINGKPLFIYALAVLDKCPSIESIVVVAHAERLKEFETLIKSCGIKKVKKIVAGGKTRCDSIKNALKVIDQNTENILIHDGARPFISKTLVEKALGLMQKEKAVILAVPVKPTIKKVDPKNLYVQETLIRETLWETQTPQIFKKDILVSAHEKMLCCEPTDDAVLVEKMGIKVKVLLGDYQNIKITTPEDLDLAKAILAKSK